MSFNSSPTEPNRRRLLQKQTLPQAPATQPSLLRKPASGSSQPPFPPRRRGFLGRIFHSPLFLAGLVVLFALFLVGGASAAAGWSGGRAEFHATATFQSAVYMLEQYNLAIDDINNSRYDLARQRLEYIYYQDPHFLDVIDQLVKVMFILNTTGQPTSAVLLSETPTPTQDPRPKEDLFNAAQGLMAASDWSTAIDTLLALRKNDATYRTADVDGMLYVALRNRGVKNIVEFGLFEQGLYDFSLAEKFGPLDGNAITYQSFARMYLFGNAFWLAYPDQAAYYYGQAMAISPDLRDASGLSAFARFWQSLVQWGDQLAKASDWCAAAEKYQQAQNARNDGNLVPTANYAVEQCLGPTEEPSSTATLFLTLTPTFTGTPGPTFTPSNTVPGPTDTATETPTVSDTPTASDTPTDTPTPNETPTDEPTTESPTPDSTP